MTDLHEIKLKTAETTALNFLNGKTEFNHARGKIQDALKYITKDEVIAIFTKIENIQMYAPNLSKMKKNNKLYLHESLQLLCSVQ